MTTSPHSSSPLISAEALKAALGTVRVFDVRFDLYIHEEIKDELARVRQLLQA